MFQKKQKEPVTRAAGTHLAHIGELVEMILQHLNFKELGQAQLVSRFWRQTVLSAPCLQQKLFERAETSYEADLLFENIPVESILLSNTGGSRASSEIGSCIRNSTIH